MNYLKQSAEDIIKKLIVILVISVIFNVLNSISINAQNVSKPDSSTASISSLADTSKFIMRKSAWGSVLRSAVLPGFGQYYNESYWKIPLFWGLLGYLGYQWNYLNNNYKDYQSLYSSSLLAETDDRVKESYYSKREFYRDQRDLFAVYIGLTYFLNLVDAYVDSHLFDFDVQTDQISNNYQLSLKIRL